MRLRVRGLIVLVLLIGAGLGWIARGARLQRDAVTAIQKAGGSVQYDWEGPKWLAGLIGVDYFGHVVTVAMTKRGSDAELMLIADLARLEGLKLEDSPVTD